MTDENMGGMITVYGAPWCPDCRRSKAFLGEHRVPYEWVDVDKDGSAQEYVRQANQDRLIIPTIVFPDGSLLVEPSNAELAQKLGLQTQARNGGQRRPAARGNQDVLRAEASVADCDGVWIHHVRAALDVDRPRVAQQRLVDALQPADLPVLVGDQRRPVEGTLAQGPAVAGGRIAKVLAEVRGVDEQLLGNAADVDAGTAEVALLCQRHTRAEARRRPLDYLDYTGGIVSLLVESAVLVRATPDHGNRRPQQRRLGHRIISRVAS